MTLVCRQLYTAFLQSHILSWLRDTIRHESHETVDSYVAGVEIIFNVDILRQAGDQKCDNSLKDVLAASVLVDPSTILGSLPRLLKSFVQSIKRHRSVLFSQGSNQTPSETALPIQAAGMAFFTLCNSLLTKTDNGDLVWHARVLLLEIVVQENLFSAHDDHAALMLRSNGELANQALSSAWQGDVHAPLIAIQP